MRKNLRWKMLTILAVAAAAAFAIYPPEDQVRLGLDLRGGVHLVLRVQTDDALRVETETNAEQLREQASLVGIELLSAGAATPTEIRVEGVPAERDQEFRGIADDLLAGDLLLMSTYNRQSAGPGAYTFSMSPGYERQLREESVRQALQTIERRVNELGVAEPIVAPHGVAGDQILVQLPGVEDVAGAKEIIRSTGLLELKLVEDGPALTRELLLQARNGIVPADMEVVSGADESLGATRGSIVYYLVRRVAPVTGRDLRNARPTIDEFNQPAISFSFNREGARKFGNFTGSNVGRNLAIILDNRVYSAPVIQERIADEGRITGTFTTGRRPISR